MAENWQDAPNSYKGANLKEGASVKLSWKANDSRALDLG